jgi:hypothetical protein
MPERQAGLPLSRSALFHFRTGLMQRYQAARAEVLASEYFSGSRIDGDEGTIASITGEIASLCSRMQQQLTRLAEVAGRMQDWETFETDVQAFLADSESVGRLSATRAKLAGALRDDDRSRSDEDPSRFGVLEYHMGATFSDTSPNRQAWYRVARECGFALEVGRVRKEGGVWIERCAYEFMAPPEQCTAAREEIALLVAARAHTLRRAA